MSYDLSFVVRPGTEAPTPEAVRAWLATRRHWKDVDGDTPRYENEATGVRISFSFHDEPGEGEDAYRAPFFAWVSDIARTSSGSRSPTRSRRSRLRSTCW